MSLNVISHEVLITSLDIIQMMVVSNITVNLVRMKRNVFKCNKPRGPYHKFGYFPDDGSKQYNRTLYDSLLLSFGGA